MASGKRVTNVYYGPEGLVAFHDQAEFEAFLVTNKQMDVAPPSSPTAVEPKPVDRPVKPYKPVDKPNPLYDPPARKPSGSSSADPTGGPPPPGRKGPNFKPQPYDPDRARPNTTGGGNQANEPDAGTSLPKPGGPPPTTGSSPAPDDPSYTAGQRATAAVALVAMGVNIALNSWIVHRNEKAIQAALNTLDHDLRQQRAEFPTLGFLLTFRFARGTDSGEGPTAKAAFRGLGYIPAPTRAQAERNWSNPDPSMTYEFAWIDPIDFSAQAPPAWDRIAEASLIESDDIEFQRLGFRQHGMVGQAGFFGMGRYGAGSSTGQWVRENIRFFVLSMPSKIPYYDVGRGLDQMDVTVRDVYALGGLVPTLDVGQEGAVPVVAANPATKSFFDHAKSDIEVDDKANALRPNSYIEHVAWLPPSQIHVTRFLDVGYEKRTAQRDQENRKVVEEMAKRAQEQARLREQEDRERRRLEEEDEQRREQEVPGAGAGSRSG